jgi:hypothetical protein
MKNKDFDTEEYWDWFDAPREDCSSNQPGVPCAACQTFQNKGYPWKTAAQHQEFYDMSSVDWKKGKRPKAFHEIMEANGWTDKFHTGPQPLGGWQPNEYKEVAVAVEAVWKPPTEAPPGGCNCRKCNQNNPYAAPNRKDGSYVCYTCR